MNLATRCLSCGTVFRVGEEQLLASDGWVRCGRCNSVFNAAEVLFDTDTGAPMRLALPPAGDPPVDDPAPAPAQAPPPLRAYPDEPLLRAPSRSADDDGQDADEPIIITDHVAPPAPQQVLQADDGPPDMQAADSLAVLPAADQAAPAAAALVADAPASPTVAPAQPLPVQATPSFLRQSERSARWQHPAMRMALVAGVAVLALALLLQMALLWRDTLAAHLPRTTPALQALCRLAGCSVQPLRRIQQLAVSSSGLNRLEGSSLYRLQLVLHNRADTAVMMPALDLSLTDPQGQLVARRVLPVTELGVPQAALQPGEELPIKVLVSTSDRRVAGYTLEVFYP